MISLRHAALALACTALAAALAFALGVLAPDLSWPAAAAFAGLAVLAYALTLLALAGRRAVDELRHEAAGLRDTLEALHRRQDAIDRELGRARDEARQIFQALADAGHAGGGLRQVMGEVRVLQRLVEQLREQRQQPAAPAVPGAAAAAESPLTAPAVAAAPALPTLEVVREALSAGRVDLVLQPIVALPQRHRRFYECFSRMRDGDGRLVRPEQYLDIAAAEGLLPAIDNLLLFRCIQMIRRARQRSAGVGFFCNISQHSLADRDFLRDFADFLDQNRDLASSLVLEMAQDSLDLGDRDLAAQMDRLAGYGLRFSIDHVTALPLDAERLAQRHVRFVKLSADRLIVPADDAPSPAVLRDALAQHGIALIADRIETERQLVELLEFDIPYGQGYLFGEPRPAPEI